MDLRNTSCATHALLCALMLMLSACSSAQTGEESRSYVIGNPTQLGDLYWRGELTDSKGQRWDVWIIPGVASSVEDGLESMSDALRYGKRPLEAQFWRDRAEEISDGLEFAFVDSLKEFVYDGIVKDYREASDNISANMKQTPFGWIPRIAGNALWGYFLKPVGRVAFGPVGMTGGISATLLLPTGQLILRPVGGTTWFALAGLAGPSVKLALHQLIYMFSVFNREPGDSQNGDFGLEIILDANGKRPEAKSPPDPPSPNGAVNPKKRRSEEEHLRRLSTDPNYRRAYNRGYRSGLLEGRREAYRRVNAKKK
jgi:hypothetical protein